MTSKGKKRPRFTETWLRDTISRANFYQKKFLSRVCAFPILSGQSVVLGWKRYSKVFKIRCSLVIWVWSIFVCCVISVECIFLPAQVLWSGGRAIRLGGQNPWLLPLQLHWHIQVRVNLQPDGEAWDWPAHRQKHDWKWESLLSQCSGDHWTNMMLSMMNVLCGLIPQPCSTKVIELLEKHLEVVLGIAFAIAILLVSTHTHTHTHTCIS